MGGGGSPYLGEVLALVALLLLNVLGAHVQEVLDLEHVARAGIRHALHNRRKRRLVRLLHNAHHFERKLKKKKGGGAE